jgi:uncharacterized protein YcfJ
MLHCTPKNSQRRISSIGQGSAGTVDANTDTTDQVAHADQHSTPEQRISGVVVAARVGGIAADLSQFGGENDAHDDTVNGDNLTEDNGDQVLGADAWRFHTTTEDRSSSNEDSPVFSVSARILAHLSAVTLGDSYHAAPITEKPMQRPIPADAQA